MIRENVNRKSIAYDWLSLGDYHQSHSRGIIGTSKLEAQPIVGPILIRNG